MDLSEYASARIARHRRCETAHLEDALLALLVVPINAGEVVEIPLEVAVLALAARERKFGPAVDIVKARNLLVAVVLSYLSDGERLGLVCSGFVIENRVNVDYNAVLLELGDAILEFLDGAPFGCFATFLVEFPQVVKIVDIVSFKVGLNQHAQQVTEW